jgi:hypothetical protein
MERAARLVELPEPEQRARTREVARGGGSAKISPVVRRLRRSRGVSPREHKSALPA